MNGNMRWPAAVGFGLLVFLIVSSVPPGAAGGGAAMTLARP